MQKNFIALVFLFAMSTVMATEEFFVPVKMSSSLEVNGVLNAKGDISITSPGGPDITGTMIRGTSNAVNYYGPIVNELTIDAQTDTPGLLLRTTSNAVVALSKPNLFYSTATATITQDTPVPFANSFSGNSGDVISTLGGTVFTLPAAGVYEVSWQVFGEVVGGLPQGYFVVTLNGATDKTYSAIGYASTNEPVNGHTLIQAVNGDTISIYNRLGTFTPAYFGGISGLSGAPTGTLMIKRVA